MRIDREATIAAAPARGGPLVVIRKLLAPLLATALLALPSSAAAPPASAASLPPGFVGISPQNPINPDNLELIRRAGVRNLRMPVYWFGVQPTPGRLDWSLLENTVKLAAEQRLRVMPFIWGTPEWLTAKPSVEPMGSPRARRGWMRMLRSAARQYGPNGRFWSRHPDLPYVPIRRWEIWNEPNIVTFSHNPNPARFAKLMKISARAIGREDPGATLLVGGLFGKPLQIPPNIDSDDFIDRMYRVPGARQAFDGIGLHPYVRFAREIVPQARDLRRVLRKRRDPATKLYFTELGWGSDGFESRWELGPYGQARELHRSFALLARKRHAWRVGSIEWFSLADMVTHCQFCDSSGLLTAEGRAKPSWYRFIRWTKGERGLVRRAPLPLIPVEKVHGGPPGGGPGSA